MNDLENLTRRELLKMSGLSIAGITFLAACGAQSGVTASPNIASAGTVPPTTALGEVVVSDTVLLRTAASLEYSAIDAYTTMLDGGLLTGDFASLKDAIKRFRDDHNGHADAINTLVVSYGGKAHKCANTRVNNIYVDPALKLITADGNADAARDAVTLTRSRKPGHPDLPRHRCFVGRTEPSRQRNACWPRRSPSRSRARTSTQPWLYGYWPKHR